MLHIDAGTCHLFARAVATACLRLETAVHLVKFHHYGYLSLGGIAGKHFAEHLVVITVQGKSRSQVLRHLEGEEPITLGTVHTEPLQFAPVVQEAQAVAVGKVCRPCHIEAVAPNLLHLPHILADGFRRVKTCDVRLPTVEEVVGKSTVESLLQVGFESIGYLAARSPAIFVGTARHYLVQLLAVRRHYVLHIVHVLEASLYLERAGTCISQVFEAVYLAQVFQRQQVALVLYLVAVGIEQVKLQAAELCTLAPVG